MNLPEAKVIAWIKARFEFKTRKRNTEYLICNPFDGDSGFNFNINVASGKCWDWRGNEWAGPINPKTNKRNCSFINFVMKFMKCGFRQALESILNSKDVKQYLNSHYVAEQLPELTGATIPIGYTKLSEDNSKPAVYVKNWLKYRGYTEEDIGAHDIKSSGTCVLWPYYEYEELVYWQARSAMTKSFEFPNELTTGLKKTNYLYGFDLVEPASSYYIITESIFVAYTLGAQALASGGAALDDNQISKLRLLSADGWVILAPDNDVAGVKSVISNGDKLHGYGFKVCFSLPPTEYGGKKIKDYNELITDCKLSRDAIRSIFDDSIQQYNLKSKLQLLQMVK